MIKQIRHRLGLAWWRLKVKTGIRTPEQDRVEAMRPIFALRYEATKDVLIGRGVELGAGPNPQRLPRAATCEYFDIRNESEIEQHFGKGISYEVHPIEQIPQRFPEGVDFLLAHNVLEHTSDPIKALLEWFSWVRDGGVVVISMPDMNYLPADAGRLVPPLEHILLDHVLERDDDSFESREHIYSFLLGWWDHVVVDSDKAAYVQHCLSEARRSGHDLHWHALDCERGTEVIEAAGLFGGIKLEFIRICNTESEPIATLGETIYVFRVDQASPLADSSTRTELLTLAKRLAAASKKLEQAANI